MFNQNLTIFFTVINYYLIEFNYFFQCGSLLINGGAISFSINNSTLFLKNSIIKNCIGKNGGSIYFLNNILKIYQCCFLNIISNENGASIYTNINNIQQLINESVFLKCIPNGSYNLILNDGLINLKSNNFTLNSAKYGAGGKFKSINSHNSIQYCQISDCMGGYIICFEDESHNFDQYSYSTNFINISITNEAIIVVHYGKKIVENFLIISKVPIGLISNNGKLYFKNSFTTSNNLLNAININSLINLNELTQLIFTYKTNCIFKISQTNYIYKFKFLKIFNLILIIINL